MTDDQEPPVNDNLSDMARQVKPAIQALNMAAMVFAAWGHPSGRRVDPMEPEPEVACHPEPVEKKGTA
jgi:hypothetical protein